MICTDCNSGFYPQMISTGTCWMCGKPTPTPHIPSYMLCDECSIENGLCKQCGKEMVVPIK
jgi:hypothetical protein